MENESVTDLGPYDAYARKIALDEWFTTKQNVDALKRMLAQEEKVLQIAWDELQRYPDPSEVDRS